MKTYILKNSFNIEEGRASPIVKSSFVINIFSNERINLIKIAFINKRCNNVFEPGNIIRVRRNKLAISIADL